MSIIKTGMYTCAQIPLVETKEIFNRAIDDWVKDSQVYGNKQEAAKRILECFQSKSTFLNLSNLDLNTLPKCIGDLVSLQELDLSGNQLSTLPETIGNLISLQELDLSGNQLSTLPETIGNLISLQIFNLSENQLIALPENIGNLVFLKILDLFQNCLIILPESIGNLASLQELNLYKNKLTTLPESIGNLISLQELYLYENQLHSLPNNICNLSALISLELSRNNLTKLPDHIDNLTSLQQLNISENNLATLPSSICNLTSLQELYLFHNQLTSLPDHIGNLTSLQELDLLENQITILPHSIHNLTNLSYNFLSDNYTGNLEDIDNTENIFILLEQLEQWNALAQDSTLIPDNLINILTKSQKTSLNTWLFRLIDTEEYNFTNRERIAQTVCAILNTLITNETFRSQFFMYIENNFEGCENRTAQSFNEVFVLWKMATLPKECSLQEKVQLLAKAAKTLTLRKALAKKIAKINEELSTKNIPPIKESVEIYLYYECTLQHELGLLTFIRKATHDKIGCRNEISIETLRKEVNDGFMDTLLELVENLPIKSDIFNTDYESSETKLLEESYKELDRLQPLSPEPDIQASAASQDTIQEQKANLTQHEGKYLNSMNTLAQDHNNAIKNLKKTYLQQFLDTPDIAAASY